MFETLRKKFYQIVYKDNGDCCCYITNSVTLLAQSIGIFLPSRIKTVSSNFEDQSGKSCPCEVKCKLKSFPNLLNFLWFILISLTTSTIYFRLSEHMAKFFKGTDLYTFGTHVILYYLQGIIILLNSRIKSSELIKAWHYIRFVYKSLCITDKHNKTTLIKLRIWANIVPFIIVGNVIFYGYHFLTVILSPCFNASSVNTNQANSNGCYCLLNFDFVIEKFVHPNLFFYPQTTVGLFSIFCFIISIMHNEIQTKLFAKLNSSTFNSKFTTISENLPKEKAFSFSSPSDAETQLKASRLSELIPPIQVEQLRIFHEKLCNAGRCMGNYFGLPILMVLCTSTLSIICGIYTMILKTQIPYTDFEVNLKDYLNIWEYHLFYSLGTLIALLISGQAVADSGSGVLRVMNEAPHENLDDKTKYQLSVFMAKVTSSSSELWAWNVCKIGMSFLSSAVVNVTTYLLVILQFRFTSNQGDCG